jgi:D-3-phosphoglycerate dehydrogenase
VVRAGAGYDNIDLKAATAHNVVAMNTPGQNSNAVAELAIGMMIYMARGKFNGKSGSELAGKALVLYGYGFVARYVAKIAKGIGMEVYAYDPYLTNEIMTKDGVKPLASVEDIFKKGDYISLHIPANEQTKKSINWSLLSLMKPGAILVNTARKEVINEDDLIKALPKSKSSATSARGTRKCRSVNRTIAIAFTGLPRKWAPKRGSQYQCRRGIRRQIIAFFEKGDKTYKVKLIHSPTNYPAGVGTPAPNSPLCLMLSYAIIPHDHVV